VTSPRGGVFYVFIDGFNTSTTIDTYSGGDEQLPQCIPFQFPPVAHPPSDMGARNEHTITLVYTRHSSRAPHGTNSSEVQIDTFAIPIFQEALDTGDTSSASTLSASKTHFVLFFTISLFIISYQ
jgi:hypothetical protein